MLMEMKINEMDIRILRPNEGCLLTKSADVDIKERIFSEEQKQINNEQITE